MEQPLPIEFENSYSRLPPDFYSLIPPNAFPNPQIAKLNSDLAKALGLPVEESFWAAQSSLLSGGQGTIGDNRLLAMAYSGHQFGQFNPGLGDGRAALIGEISAPDGNCYDLHLKGSGPTPYSRGGDGKAALGPVMREYILSEAMHALGVPTTRSLAIVTTGEKVFRDGILPGAVLARIASSHIRVGTFQHFAARGDLDNLKALLDYAVNRHYPNLSTVKDKAIALFEAVQKRQAELIAKWMCIGFIHGVMNTDNMTISGETIDYGPCAFMDHYEHYKIYSSIDRQGRYAFGRQPQIAKWNLARLVEALLPLIDDDDKKAVEKAGNSLEKFDSHFTRHWLLLMGKKLGLEKANEADRGLIVDFLSMLQATSLDFTNAFRSLEMLIETDMPGHFFESAEGWPKWSASWRDRLASENGFESIGIRLNTTNPIYIPRNHLVAEAIKAGEEEGDMTVMDRLLDMLTDPFTEREGLERYAQPPGEDEIVHQTFCGT